jgi:hypothetical protein
LDFKNYDSSELFEIGQQMFGAEKYQLSDAALTKFKFVIDEIFVTGNARTVRNLVAKV